MGTSRGWKLTPSIVPKPARPQKGRAAPFQGSIIICVHHHQCSSLVLASTDEQQQQQQQTLLAKHAVPQQDLLTA
jgi:hypothetical protein